MQRHFLGVCLVVLVVVACTAYIGFANTITVENLSQDTTTGVYTYAITFDSEAHVDPGDGFTVYNFNGLTSWSLTGSGGSGSLNSSGMGTTSTGPISLTESVTGSTLSDGNANTIANADAGIVATDNGLSFSTTVPDLTFSYGGPPVPYTGSASAVLTLTSSDISGDSTGVYASVDRSGSNPGTTYGTAEGTVFVPAIGAAMPEPTAGLLALASVGGLMLVRRRRLA